MAGTKGIRWPDDLCGIVEKAAIEDERNFSTEVIYLVRLGLAERDIRMASEKARYKERMENAVVPKSLSFSPVFFKEIVYRPRLAVVVHRDDVRDAVALPGLVACLE